MPAGRPTDYTKELGDEICVRPCIYGLYDQSGKLRYIGKANNPEKRLASHMRDSVRRDTPVYRWIRKNGKPEMRILESDCADWRESERRLISEARVSGANLLNVAEGGDEPHCSIETRRANGSASKTWQNHHKRMHDDVLYRVIQKMKLRFPRMAAMHEKFGNHEEAESYRIQMRKMAKGWPEEFGKWINV